MNKQKSKNELKDIKLKNKQEFEKVKLQQKNELESLRSKFKVSKIKEKEIMINAKTDEALHKEKIKKDAQEQMKGISSRNKTIQNKKQEISEAKNIKVAEIKLINQEGKNDFINLNKTIKQKAHEVKQRNKVEKARMAAELKEIKIQKKQEKLLLLDKRKESLLKKKELNLASKENYSNKMSIIINKKREIAAIKKENLLKKRLIKEEIISKAKAETDEWKAMTAEALHKHKIDLLELKIKQKDGQILSEIELNKYKDELEQLNNKNKAEIKEAHEEYLSSKNNDEEDFNNIDNMENKILENDDSDFTEIDSSINNDNVEDNEIKNLESNEQKSAPEDNKYKGNTNFLEQGASFSKKQLNLLNNIEGIGKPIEKFKKSMVYQEIIDFGKINPLEKNEIKSIIKYTLIKNDQNFTDEYVDNIYLKQLHWLIQQEEVRIGSWTITSVKRSNIRIFDSIQSSNNISLFNEDLANDYHKLIDKKLNLGATIMISKGLAVKLEDNKLKVYQDTNVTGG